MRAGITVPGQFPMSSSIHRRAARGCYIWRGSARPILPPIIYDILSSPSSHAMPLATSFPSAGHASEEAILANPNLR
ncbi:hypothetical protein PAHAL_4G242100 [Panicum hallii]|uniref:Uncharacterized protein n=1 Tax=Panicum hallii TaxID=206008 RepID=A0A2T8JDU3_9POAL|nr:hypothetical protein PAHAL_4G242100 [Panicum hallii]